MMKKTSIYLIFLYLLLSNVLIAQQDLHFIESRYSDSFSQWLLHFDEDEQGTVELKWPTRNDWSQWSIDVGDYYGTLKQARAKDPNHWQAKINGFIIDFRTTYPGDLTQWTIRYADHHYKLYLPYKNQVENWTLESTQDFFDVFTSFEGDPRDWSFEESKDSQIPTELKLASTVLIISLSTPNI
jgi:hypothetical protein